MNPRLPSPGCWADCRWRWSWREPTWEEDYTTLEEMARKHPGVTPLEGDLLTALRFCPADDKSIQPRLQTLLRVLQRESHNLRKWDPIQAPAIFAQQIRNRAFVLGPEPLAQGGEDRLASLGQGHALLRWRASLESPALVRTLSGHGGGVDALAVTGDGRVVSASWDGTVKVWDLASGQEERRLSADRGRRVSALALTGDGRILSGSDDRTVRLWNLNNGLCLETVPLDSSPRSLDVKVGADGITLVVGEASGAVSCFLLVLPCTQRSALTPEPG